MHLTPPATNAESLVLQHRVRIALHEAERTLPVDLHKKMCRWSSGISTVTYSFFWLLTWSLRTESPWLPGFASFVDSGYALPCFLSSLSFLFLCGRQGAIPIPRTVPTHSLQHCTSSSPWCSQDSFLLSLALSGQWEQARLPSCQGTMER